MSSPDEQRTSTVISYRLPEIDDPRCTNIRAWAIPQLEEIDTKLRAAKSLIDKPYKTDRKKWDYITKQMEVSYHISKRIQSTIPLATNTVSKLIELLHHFSGDIFSRANPKQPFVHFDNAALPGIFPYTMNYYMQSFHPHLKYKWHASSLISTTKEVNDPLKDQYGLWKNYPNNWLMDKNNNGDVMNMDVQLNFKERIGGTVDLYTSDIGFDVSMNYNEQETLQSPANLGQIISGLITLKVGGVLITKQYTFMTPFTVSVMGLMTRLFERAYITKPMTSKPDNSETYLVCVGFKGLDPETEAILLEHLSTANVVYNDEIIPMKPIVQKKCINTDFINAIIQATHHFSGNTIAKIIENVKNFESNEPTDDLEEHVDHWFHVNAVPKLPLNKFLNVNKERRRYGIKQKYGASKK
jgi:23S rRNA U2552 (ribose-2'-O)-methylase RlmE/FtsJ